MNVKGTSMYARTNGPRNTIRGRRNEKTEISTTVLPHFPNVKKRL